MPTKPAALVISYSEIITDPRVRRQVDWLTSAGWVVDSLGLGPHPTSDVRDHFTIAAPPSWLKSRVRTAAVYRLLRGRRRFRAILGDRIPVEISRRVADGLYGAVVFNEFEFTPWVADDAVFTPAARRARIHLDMHEYREPGRRGGTLWHRVTASYYRWVRRFIAHPAFTSRSTVATAIAALYEGEFSIPPMSIIRNIPPYVDQSPSTVDSHRIKMLFHGLASWERGWDQILGALRILDDRFTMTFMLMPNERVIDELRSKIGDEFGNRVQIVPPAPMREIAARINEYDLEVVFYPPVSTNVELALPNKVFEAIQGRLGLVIGESPMLADVVRRYGNGVIVRGWTSEALAAALASLDAAGVARLKAASDAAAKELNASAEGEVFLAAVLGKTDPNSEQD